MGEYMTRNNVIKLYKHHDKQRGIRKMNNVDLILLKRSRLTSNNQQDPRISNVKAKTLKHSIYAVALNELRHFLERGHDRFFIRKRK